MTDTKLAKPPGPTTGWNSKRVKTPAMGAQQRPPVRPTSIVPRETIAGNALMLVISIMTFLVCITFGAVTLVSDTASSWQNDIAREVTIQIRPLDGIDMDKMLDLAKSIAEKTDGIASVDIIDEEATARLLEPWLGKGLNLDDLPIPRLLSVKLETGQRANFEKLKEELLDKVPGASLDDHQAWSKRLTTMAGVTVAVGVIVMILVLLATILTVVFATRGAMAGNRHIIEVLHLVGAEESFIAGQFQRHFLMLGLKGGMVGGITAVFVFLVAGFWLGVNVATPESDQVSALFGSFSVGLYGYLGAAIIVVLIAFSTAYTSRLTVLRHISALDGLSR